MNYYEHHIGDYAEATAHLTFVEDAAYSRLIRKYYALEGPLPAEMRAVQRLVCARSEEEREAIQIVLDEFFTLQDDGWHNARCDEEITRYRAKQEKARSSANARWNKGKPQSEGNPDAMPPESGRNANASPNPCERTKDEYESNAHQSPVTRPTTEANASFVGGSHTLTRDPVLGTTVPADFEPDQSHRGIALNMGLNLQTERDKFVDHYTATGEVLAEWPAKFRNWLRNAVKHGDSKYQQPRTGNTNSRDDARRSAANTLGVGSQYLTGGMDHEQLAG